MPSDISKAQELRDERARLATENREIIESPEGDDGALSTEQGEKFDRLHERSEELRAEVEGLERLAEENAKRLERLEEVEADLKASRPLSPAARRDIEPEETAEGRGAPSGDEVSNAFQAWMRGGVSGLNPEQRDIMARRQATLTPEERALSTTDGSAGGFAIPEDSQFMNRIIEARLQFGGMRRSRAFVFETDNGQDIPVVTDDDTSNSGVILPENTAAAEQDVVLGQVLFKAFTYSSKLVKVPLQLLQDVSFNLDSWLAAKLGMRIERALEAHLATGDGVSKPEGLTVNGTTGVTGASGQTTSVTWDDLVDLKHSVDIAYRDSPEWMFHDLTLRELKKIVDGNGRPLWQSGVAIGEPDSIDGDPYVVNNDMPLMAASAVSIAYGDFSQFWVRDVRGAQLLRLSERYAEALQVAFLMFSRHDGKLVDAGTNPIKLYVNAAS